MSDPRRNAEGYLDVTAYLGTKNVIQEENEAERKEQGPDPHLPPFG